MSQRSGFSLSLGFRGALRMMGSVLQVQVARHKCGVLGEWSPSASFSDSVSKRVSTLMLIDIDGVWLWGCGCEARLQETLNPKP